MSELINTSKRQLVPRWHDSSVGLKHFKWRPRKRVDTQQAIRELEDDFNAWLKNKTLPVAMELAEKLNNFDIDMPKSKTMLHNFLSRAKNKLSPESILFITASKNEAQSHQLIKVLDIRARISELKNRTRNSQADPLAWHDLAFHYSILNEDIKAEKCLKIAMKISRGHPYIVRSYSRFLVHKADPEKAIRILTKQNSLDPRIISADVSIRARFGIGQPNLKQARKMVERHESTPGIISELAASLGTIDCEVGHGKRAKKYIETSLRDHTENVEAQIRWLLQRYKTELPLNLIAELSSPEANAIDLYERDLLRDCRDSLISVYEFQPFSAGSLIDATFLSVALGDNESVISLSNKYAHAIGENDMALNNLAVALILSDNLDDANKILIRLEHTNFSKNDESTFLATKGLMKYRLGDYAEGRRFYESARDRISRSDKREIEALSFAFQSSEEIKINREAGIELIERAEKLSPRTSLEKEIANFTKLVRETNNLAKQ